MEGFRAIFQGVDDPRKSNATKRGLIEMLAVALLAALPSDQVAIDGKVLRGAILDALKRSALHLVQAFEPGSGLVLGQMKVDGKSNEITAIPGLLEMLDLM